ncbi:MAG: hypothetical protein V7K53_06500 [Nostoc sp.]|uniref:hypothetical protein n=1 Tax=Nostoc sp. TaxID=1180 RepID=UPI002FF7C5B5
MINWIKTIVFVLIILALVTVFVYLLHKVKKVLHKKIEIFKNKIIEDVTNKAKENLRQEFQILKGTLQEKNTWKNFLAKYTYRQEGELLEYWRQLETEKREAQKNNDEQKLTRIHNTQQEVEESLQDLRRLMPKDYDEYLVERMKRGSDIINNSVEEIVKRTPIEPIE